ncbi:8754_t:CDS:2 [Ambispora leptoticha]|uniref:8754_t:CDS:1 n=1 Tax=Ambispora leptoticha TaxID=144679 RepID=A0A9N9DBM6_9GLOM|nr:8754_t:CDS:2 [Ambispora leptoticha]
MRAVENIVQERRLLEEIEYPLVCNLRYAFQDDENMFMVLDLMLGGDLRFHLERQGQMKEEVVKFYVAEVSLGLHYLHSKKIVHRDLKPDNVLLDEKGHAHLTDFNIAIHFTEKKPLTSVAGSMAYMGVVMYELLFSKRPFRGKTNSALTHAILHEPLQFPENVSDLVSEECIDCLSRFCERDISKRLGCGPNGIEDIKRHPWFSDIEWDRLDTKQAKAPFVPDSKRANFDATHELEELLLEDNPLKAKKRANPNQDLSELSKEMRMMEERFLNYDFTKMRRIKRRKSENRNLNNLMATGERGASTTSSLPRYDYAATAEGPNYHNFNSEKNNNADNTQLMEKINKGEWLNERPASPQNRERRSTLAFAGLVTNGRSSPVISSDSDYFSMKPYPPTNASGRVSPPGSIAPSITDSLKCAPSSLSTINTNHPPVKSPIVSPTTSLTPPPRVQSPTIIAQVTSAKSPPPTLTSSSSNSSFNSRPRNDSIPSIPPSISTHGITSSSAPPPSRVHTLSPPATSKRPQILDSPDYTTLISTEPKQLWPVELDENATTTPNTSTTSGSAGSRLSSEISVGRSRGSGHFRTASDVSNGSGALSAVGVPAGL